MSIPVYIVDDESHGIEGLKRMINRVPELYLVDAETNPISALSKIHSGVVKADIIFVDVDMPDLNGFDFAEQVKEFAVVIIVTAHPEHALSAFGAEAADFITKPIDLKDFLRAIRMAKEKLIARKHFQSPNNNQQFIFVKLTPRNIVKVNLEDLVFISIDDKYVELHILNSKPIMIKKTLAYVEEILPREQFLRIHKSHMVNLAHLSSLLGNKAILKDGKVLEIGSTYLDEVYSRFNSL